VAAIGISVAALPIVQHREIHIHRSLLRDDLERDRADHDSGTRQAWNQPVRRSVAHWCAVTYGTNHLLGPKTEQSLVHLILVRLAQRANASG
jgi:hypothetical protein